MGSHYGVKVRKRYNAAKAQQAGHYECPKCGKRNVRRKSFALWECRSCHAVFAGGAYTPETTVGTAARKALVSAKTPSRE